MLSSSVLLEWLTFLFLVLGLFCPAFNEALSNGDIVGLAPFDSDLRLIWPGDVKMFGVEAASTSGVADTTILL